VLKNYLHINSPDIQEIWNAGTATSTFWQ